MGIIDECVAEGNLQRNFQFLPCTSPVSELWLYNLVKHDSIYHQHSLKYVINVQRKFCKNKSKSSRKDVAEGFVNNAHLQVLKESEFPFLAPDGRRNFSGSSKCRQWLHLYKSYGATYTLKCLLFEKIAKNRFTAPKLVFRDFLKKNWNISKSKGLRALETSFVCHNMLIAVILHPIWGLQLQKEVEILIF